MSRENYSSEPEEFIASLKEKLEEKDQQILKLKQEIKLLRSIFKQMNNKNKCEHYDREEIDQSPNIKRIKCKDCKYYKCLECDNFFFDEELTNSKFWLNFCSNECMFNNMKKEEKNAKIS